MFYGTNNEGSTSFVLVKKREGERSESTEMHRKTLVTFGGSFIEREREREREREILFSLLVSFVSPFVYNQGFCACRIVNMIK